VQRMSRRAHGWSGPGSAEGVEWRDGAEPLVQVVVVEQTRAPCSRATSSKAPCFRDASSKATPMFHRGGYSCKQSWVI
jgi:hypothetical protein